MNFLIKSIFLILAGVSFQSIAGVGGGGSGPRPLSEHTDSSLFLNGGDGDIQSRKLGSIDKTSKLFVQLLHQNESKVVFQVFELENNQTQIFQMNSEDLQPEDAALVEALQKSAETNAWEQIVKKYEDKKH